MNLVARRAGELAGMAMIGDGVVAAADPMRVSGEDARGAEINLRTPASRWIFFAGLAAFVILAIVLRLAGLS